MVKRARVEASQTSNVWKGVKRDIELKILNGTFVAGERIPSVRKIAEDYDVGQTTAQKILNALCQEGIIESRRGVGYFVVPYIREQLISERKKSLERKVLSAVEEAEHVNVDLISMITEFQKKKRQE